MPRDDIKREVDLQTIEQWIDPNARVLDLGCGTGLFLQHLQKTKNAYTVGVDNDPDKSQGCVKKGVNAYQGTVEDLLDIYPEDYFDWVVISRTMQELENSSLVIASALKVGRNLAVGFINYGFWANRWSILTKGHRPINDVYPNPWHKSNPVNPVTIHAFEKFCHSNNYTITNRTFLDGSWRKEIHFMPNLLAGYAIYSLTA